MMARFRHHFADQLNATVGRLIERGKQNEIMQNRLFRVQNGMEQSDMKAGRRGYPSPAQLSPRLARAIFLDLSD